MTRDMKQVETEVQGLREELEAVQARATEYEAALEELARQRNEAAGRFELAQRQAAEYGARLAERETELAEAKKRDETYQRFRSALERRDAAASEAAAAIDGALERFEAFVELQGAVVTARAEVAPGYDVSVSKEPEELVDAWQRLVDVVRQKIDEQLQDEVVDAAARSIAGHDIAKLPEYLQAVARMRRRQLLTKAPATKAPTRTQ